MVRNSITSYIKYLALEVSILSGFCGQPLVGVFLEVQEHEESSQVAILHPRGEALLGGDILNVEDVLHTPDVAQVHHFLARLTLQPSKELLRKYSPQ